MSRNTLAGEREPIVTEPEPRLGHRKRPVATHTEQTLCSLNFSSDGAAFTVASSPTVVIFLRDTAGPGYPPPRTYPTRGRCAHPRDAIAMDTYAGRPTAKVIARPRGRTLLPPTYRTGEPTTSSAIAGWRPDSGVNRRARFRLRGRGYRHEAGAVRGSTVWQMRAAAVR
jgi:hypothetical protein